MANAAHDGRKFTGLFVKPGAQFKVFFLAAGLGQLILSLTFLAYLYFIEYIFTAGIDPSATEEILRNFQDSVFWMRIVIISMTVIILGVSFIIMNIVLHRVLGTAVPLLRMIETLKEGAYGEQRALRKSDEMQEVMGALNDLSITLEKRHPK